MPSCAIIAIGNELLQGDVLDTNTHWLIRQITGIGGRVERAIMIRDDPDEIVHELRDAHARQTDLIITSGGLGPTEDDLTIEAVAHAVGVPLALDPQAREMVAETFRQLAAKGLFASAELTPAREKMARLPQGAIPLGNTAGAAPGVLLRWDSSTVVSLPGVPGELKAIYNESLQPTLGEIFGESTFREWSLTVDCGDESLLAPVLAVVCPRHRQVYVKSRARRLGIDLTFEITLSLAGSNPIAIESALEAAADDLQTELRRAGLTVLELKRT